MSLLADSDGERIARIGRYQVLDRPPRADLVALVEIAALAADVPMAAITLVTDTEQHQVAAVGFDGSVCARAGSMCDVVLAGGEPVVVADAGTDPRFRDDPSVTGALGAVRSYAGHPLVTPDGTVIGALCVFDTRARELTSGQARALAGLADRVVDLLELELRTRELTATVEDLRRAQAELERSNAALAAFAGQVSHDLRNPLTALTMALSMLAEEGADEDAGRRFLLDRARNGTHRMQLLIDDLLTVARVGD
ncbi:histidine kinase dimerization/phospho-acceptor domain-containing protein [Nocardioides dongkuii]|uniref:histidine kinase dimerization/phospho-acceptor domain-containing protein n=1 Tax=Nocardioides dongkuii TaxID=2760089 RepID=UPI0018788F1F|nr:histidine kinase dimerization/phospho-acceptor domain-containing protein [Nocardioides dongkuii]